jgi:GMP synthase-like glutamine amidotransferase
MPRILLIDNGSKLTNRIMDWFEQKGALMECINFIPPTNPKPREKNVEIQGTFCGPHFQMQDNHIDAVILSGSSCFNPLMEWFPTPPPGFWPYCNQHAIPILGICYGHQLIAQQFGGQIVKERQYEEKTLKKFRQTQREDLFLGLPEVFEVSMYHECSVVRAPPHFECIGTTIDGMVGAMVLRNFENGFSIHGIQFHPESNLTPTVRDLVFENFWNMITFEGRLL